MTHSFLTELTETLKTYVEMASALFDLDVDINDENLARVAATGRFNKRVGQPIYTEGNVSKHVMSTGRFIYVSDPSTDPLCATCPNLAVCNELSELCYPIVLKNKVLGTITIASSNQQQKESLDKNFGKILGFMESISELIAMKVLEYQFQEKQEYNLKLQYQLMNLIDECVMIMSPDKKDILYCNLRTEKVLGFKLEQLKYFKKLGKFSLRRVIHRDYTQDEYIIRIKNESIRLTGTSYPVEGMHKSEANSVFILNDARTLHDRTYLSEFSRNISLATVIGTCPAIKEAVRLCDVYAYDNNPVLLCGEDGVGKNIFAQAIHNQSIHRDKPFVSGPFFFKEMHGGTEAHALSIMHDGWTQSVDNLIKGGTLYVPEVCELGRYDQEVLLKIIQNRLNLDIKVICATSREIVTETREGNLRSDLYAILDMFCVQIPAIRHRGAQDIVLFIDHFVNQYNAQLKKNVTLSPEVYKLFENYSFPGNIREIENMISLIVFNAAEDETCLMPDDLDANFFLRSDFTDENRFNLEAIERKTILAALNEFGNQNSKQELAHALGISPATLYRKLKRYEIGQTVTFE